MSYKAQENKTCTVGAPLLLGEAGVRSFENEDVLPASLLKLILLANPQAVRSETVMDALYARINPFPEDWIDEIKAGLEEVALRDQLEANVGYYTQKRRLYFDLLKDYYLSDTSESAADSTIAMMNRFSERENAYELALRYFANGQDEEASDLMEAIPDLYPFINEEDLRSHTQNCSYLNLMKHFISIDCNYDHLTAAEKDWIIYASEHNNSLFNANAINMRLEYDTSYTYSEPLLIPDEEQQYKSTSKVKKAVKKNNLNISPNPANDFFILDYTFETTPEKAELLIYDALGRKIDEIALTAISEQKLITCDTFAKGMYQCVLINNGKIISSTKLSVIK